MLKFGRNYSLTFMGGASGPLITVDPPLTLEFDSTRSIYGSANLFSLRIFNLSEAKRDAIRRDELSFQPGSFTDFEPVTLQAGYGDQLSTVITGSVLHAWTVREGVDYITEVDGWDAGFAFADAVTQGAFTANQSPQQIINSLVENLSNAPFYGLSVGSISQNYSNVKAPRGTSYSGGATDILKEVTQNGFFIDNGVIHCLQDNECIEGEALVINAQTGLIGTPLYEKTVVHIDMLFDPRVKMAQLVFLQSETQPRFNGYYKVVSIHNKGTISEAVCGTAITSLGLVNGTFSLVPTLGI